MNSIVYFYFASFWLAVLALPQLDISKDQSTCPENYSPCTCEKIISDVDTSEGWSILCEQVPISKIQAIFSQTKARDLVSFKFTIEPLEKSPIPADFLGSSRSAGLDISCEGTSYNLTINENAFRLSKNFAKQLFIRDCDLKKQANFAFLSGFQALAKLDIDSSRNLNSFQGLPSQSQLSEISISNSTGLKNMTQGQNIALPGLRALYLQNNQLDDQTLAKIFKILAESSKTSLTELKLDQNKLTRIPELVSSLTKLENFFIDDNLIISNISQPGNNSLPVLNPYGVGNYQSVRLDKNRLTRFESYIFQGMLEGMEKSDISSLSIYENPIECDCHLAWLIRHKRNLLSLVIGGHCSNSTSFEDLNPDGFKHCRVFNCPPGVDSRFRNPISCSSYYRCSAGKISLVGCPKDRLFNTSKQKCDLSINVPTCNQSIHQKEL